MQGDPSRAIFRNEIDIEDDIDDLKKCDKELFEKHNSRKLSTDSHEDVKFGNDSVSPKKKKIQISETFYSRHSPQVVGRKVYCPSPFRSLNPSEPNSPIPPSRKNKHTHNSREDISEHMKEMKKFPKQIRDVNSSVDQSLITKFRLIFLGVTKNDYMKQIHSGRLPR